MGLEEQVNLEAEITSPLPSCTQQADPRSQHKGAGEPTDVCSDPASCQPVLTQHMLVSAVLSIPSPDEICG